MEYTSTLREDKPTLRDVYTVSRLNRDAKRLLESRFPPLWVEGEISNLSRPSSGHVYFSLKDDRAQVRCALFRQYCRAIATEPRDGMHVLVRARVSLYEGRGDFQLLVEYFEEAGEGALRRAFDALKVRLAKEGLFDAAHKKPLPRLPKRIGIITSPNGAVVHDILMTLRRRFPAIPVLLYPVPVQGEGSAGKIAEVIRLAGERADCDALILARGGGSLEDLWAFNEEVVARALYASSIPVVCGVGHETDFTIADLVADVRAPTPTAAAELLSPDQQEWLSAFRQLGARLISLMRSQSIRLAQQVDWLATRLVHPRHRIEMLRHRLDALTQRLIVAQSILQHRMQNDLNTLAARLQPVSPQARIQALQVHCRHLHARLLGSTHTHLERARERIRQLAGALDTLSPLATLQRGYAIVQDARTGAVLRDARSVNLGDVVDAKLAQGRLKCRVERRDEK